MTLRQNLAYYLGVPVLLAALFSMQRSGPGMYLDGSASLLFWLLASFFFWITNDIGTRAASAVLRPVGGPFWLTLVLGSLIGLILNIPAQEWRFRLFFSLSEIAAMGVPLPAFTADYAVLVLRGWVIGALIWGATNFFMLRFLRLPRYGYEPAMSSAAIEDAQVDPAPVAPGSSTRALAAEAVSQAVPRQVLGVDVEDVMALQAQEHYVNVCARQGNRLVHHRFRDALDLVQGVPGCQVHRSYWVARAAMVTLTREGTSYRLQLTNGMKVPVGRTYLLDLKRLGITEVAA